MDPGSSPPETPGWVRGAATQDALRRKPLEDESSGVGHKEKQQSRAVSPRGGEEGQGLAVGAVVVGTTWPGVSVCSVGYLVSDEASPLWTKACGKTQAALRGALWCSEALSPEGPQESSLSQSGLLRQKLIYAETESLVLGFSSLTGPGGPPQRCQVIDLDMAGPGLLRRVRRGAVQTVHGATTTADQSPGCAPQIHHKAGVSGTSRLAEQLDGSETYPRPPSSVQQETR
ncbi:hypothetical protein CB1_001860003 [Camelus ferus]|nr:hypothetical protein CB1_001860003 [Camelus ferus]